MGLTEAQADGRACVRCGREDTPMRAVGHVDGTQTFACVVDCRDVLGGEAVAGARQGAGMSASETLRRAAKVLREHAEAATKGPWRVCAEGSEGSRIAPDVDDKRERMRFIGIANGRVQPEDGRNGRYIALVDPAVGLALADWLDTAAEDADRVAYWVHDAEPIPDTSIGRAVATARTILQEAR